MDVHKKQWSKLTKKRWLILAASCFINLCIGSLYAWSVFSMPIAEYLNKANGTTLTAADLAVVFTLANSVGPITLISGGFINDKLGPKWVIFAGGILFGTGMFLSGMANKVSTLIIGYGLGCGLGMGLVYGCTISNSVKFFPDKRGLAGGIATASYGISSVLIPPIANSLIHSTGILSAFKILGVVFIIIICGGAFLIEKCPDEFVPSGYKNKVINRIRNIDVTLDKNWKEMMKDPIFYVMILMLTCGALFGLMTISQVSPIAQNMIGMSMAQGTAAVSILALFNAAGRVAAGYVSDIIGRINTLVIMLLLAMIGLFLLYCAGQDDILKFYTGISVVGLCFGSFMGVFPGFTADQFGQKNNSVNYGIMFIGFALAGYAGPTMMSNVQRNTGSYNLAFVIAICLALVGIMLSVIYKVMNKKSQRSTACADIP
jgi:OFA family oxalate/formate antiporter-like MFS transporter